MLFHLADKKKKLILQIGIMTSSNFGSLWNVGHPITFSVVLKRYLNS